MTFLKVEWYDSVNAVWKQVRVMGIELNKRYGKLGAFIFKSPDNLEGNTLVRLIRNNKVVFVGLIIKKESEKFGKIWNYLVVERAIEIGFTLYQDASGNYRFVKQDTYDNIVDDILSGTGWSRGSSLSGTITAYFEYCDRLKALFKVVEGMAGERIWFDNENKVVYYGNPSPITIDKIIEKNVTYDYSKVVDGVVVLGAGEGIAQVIGTAGNLSGKVGVWIFKDIKSQDEADKVAQALYNVYSNPQEQINVTIPSNVAIRIGDLVRIDGTDYEVVEVQDDLNVIRVKANKLIKGLPEELEEKIRGIQEQGKVSQGMILTDIFLGHNEEIEAGRDLELGFYVPDETSKIFDCKLRIVGKQGGGRMAQVWYESDYAMNLPWANPDGTVTIPAQITDEYTVPTHTDMLVVSSLIAVKNINSADWGGLGIKLQYYDSGSGNWITVAENTGYVRGDVASQTWPVTLVAGGDFYGKKVRVVIVRTWTMQFVFNSADIMTETYFYGFRMTGGTYPSDVYVYINQKDSAHLVGYIPGGSAFDEEIYIDTDLLQTGFNKVIITSSTNGKILVAGQYRIFVETSK